MLYKQCVICGKPIATADWYAYIRLKYCKHCAAEAARRQKADYARELRRKTREQNALTRELCRNQQQEIELLRQVVQQQRERLRVLEKEAGK